MEIISNSSQAYQWIKNLYRKNQEEVWVACLNSNKTLIAGECLFRGTVNQCLIHPREIFRFVILSNASSFILFHNHPSNNSFPSKPDIEFTRKLLKLSQLMDISFEDHIICTTQSYFSFADCAPFFKSLSLTKVFYKKS